MSSIIRIKRSSVAGNPNTLAAGELAYSALTDNGSNGGDRLYIGIGTENAGNAANHFVIGGKYFTDMLDHNRGTLTANSAIVTDADNKIDDLKVDNLELNGNTLSSTDTNGNVLLDPNGTGYVQAVGTNVFVLPVGNTAQRVNDVQGAIRYNTELSSFEGYSGTNWGSLGGVKSVDGLTYITAESTPGASDDILSFVTNGTERLFIDTDSAEFDATVVVKVDNTTQSTATTDGALVVAGGVGIAKDLRVAGNIYAANFTGTGSVSLGNINITDNTISSTNTNGDINITPNGTGKTVLTNAYIGGDSIAEYVQDTVATQIVAGEGIDVTYDDGAATLTIDAEIATTSNRGVASFADANFTVTDGAVATKNITLGTSTLTNGSTTTTLAGLQQLDVDNIRIDANTISSTDTDGHINIVPNGTGDVKLTADTTVVGDANANATITTNGTGNLTLSTNEGTNSGTIVIVNGVNGDIGIIPNGDGKINLSTHIVNVGDLNTDATITTYGTGDLILNTNGGTDSGKITILDGANANIEIEPNGTGDVKLVADTTVVGDVNANATITTNGTGDLILNTNGGADSGKITILDGANANIDIEPNGTGDVNLIADTTIVGDINTDATITTNGAGDLTLSTNSGTNSGTIKIEDGIDNHIILTPAGTGDVKLVADTTVVGDLNTNAIITTNGTGDLTLSTNSGTDSGKITILDGANANIDIEPNGTGDVNLIADTTVVGDVNANATITTNGTGDLILNTNSGTDSGKITILDGVNANIEIEPNGTGDVKLVADTTVVGDVNTDAIITTNGTGDLTLSTNSGTNSGTIKIEDGIDNHIILTPAGTGDVKLVADTTVVGDADANATITTNGTGDLILNTNGGTNSGKITILDGANTNIEIEPNGTGDVKLIADTTVVGDLNTDAIITTNGTGDLTLSTNSGTDSGKITILDGANANIEIEPNGLGDVKLIADTTVVGDVNTDAIITTNGTGDLTLSTNSGTNSGTIKIEDGIDNHIILTPAGTGDVKLVADTTIVGDVNANATITTNGTGDLTLSTNSGVDSGTITIPDGADANISIDPNGTGNITVNSARIINLADPVNPQDAATKNYVDDVAQGLAVKPAVKVATTENLTATYANGTNGVGATLTLAASATLTIDGVSLTALYTGILVKNQTNAFENGRYYISQVGNLSEEWILTRCPKCDEASEIPSMYIFVQEGTVNAATGWVAVVEDFGAFDVGVDDIVFYQFAGAGNYLAGDALAFGLDGRTFNVVVAATGGIEITDDALQLKSTVAGSGLTYSNGVISVGGTTNRITVSDDAIDIASTYVGQDTITTLGTIGTGTWQGTIINPTYGGTGVNNGTKTITLGGNLTTSGAFATTLTVTAETNVTLPTTGTLATLDGTETFTNKTLTSPTITGGSINNTPIGATTASTGRFTTVTITGTDASSSTATGALVVAGGLGVGEDIYVAQDIIGAGAATSDLDGFNIDGGTY